MTRVVLLGGGYVTLHAYAALARRCGRELRAGRLEIVVVSADDCHSFHGFTGEVLAGILPVERTRTPLVDACPLAAVVHGRVTRVDTERRLVTVELVGGGVEEIGYDHVVVGTGGSEPRESVRGLSAHGHTLRGVGEVAAFADHVRGLVHAPGCPEAPADPPTVVVAGGGIAGTELAAAVADLGRGRLDVLLVHGGEELLPELRAHHPRLAQRAEAELARLGIRTMLGTRLTEVTAEGAVLRVDGSPQCTTGRVAVHDRTRRSATFLEVPGTVLATIGQAPVRLPGLEHLVRDARGRLLTRPDLSVTDGVWSAGDAARVVHPSTGEPVPANALWAIKAGGHLGRNLARVLHGRPTRPFAYQGLGQAASFGLGRSIADLYGVELTGAVAWTMRLAFFLRFMPSRRRAVAVLGDLARVAAQSSSASAPVAQAPSTGVHWRTATCSTNPCCWNGSSRSSSTRSAADSPRRTSSAASGTSSTAA